jgi:hypothetical protein
MKSILAVRQRKKPNRREEKSISRRRKIDISTKKNRYPGDEKIDYRVEEKSILRRRKNRYRGKGEIRCC